MGQGKIAIVTGAGSGIGRQVALALLQKGFHLVLAGRTQSKLSETIELAGQTLGKALAVPTDVGDRDSVDNLFAQTQKHFGRLDLIFNNAGINIPASSVEDISLDDWQRVVNTNLTGMFLCTQGAVRMMKAQSPMGGRIINNGSISAHVPRPGSVAYTATKHAVTGLTKSTNLDCRRYQICCGQIDIGNAQTSMVSRMKTGVLQANGDMVPEPTMNPDDIAGAVVFMAGLPLDTNIPFMTVMANEMPYIGRG